MKNLLYLLFAVVGLFSITSCGDDDTETQTPSELLTSPPWTLQSILVDGTEVSTACDKYEKINFNTDGTFTQTHLDLTGQSCTETTSSGTYTLTGTDVLPYNLALSYTKWMDADTSFQHTWQVTGLSDFTLEADTSYDVDMDGTLEDLKLQYKV